MPTPWDVERKRAFRASPPQKLHRYTPNHLLFQLEPCHEILRPESDAWIMDLLHIIDGDTESGSKKGGLRFGPEKGSGLCVDFDSGVATLRNATAGRDGAGRDKQGETLSPPNSAAYQSIRPSANGGDAAPDIWETSMRIRKLELYDLGGHATAPFEEMLAEKPQLRTASPEPYRPPVFDAGAGAAPVQKPSVPRVGEGELKERIQGFGPGV